MQVKGSVQGHAQLAGLAHRDDRNDVARFHGFSNLVRVIAAISQQDRRLGQVVVHDEIEALIVRCLCPGVISDLMGRPAPLTRRWILVVKPPLERPKPRRGVRLLRPLPDGGRGSQCCRSSGARPGPARSRSEPPGFAPTVPPGSTDGTGDRRSTTCRTPREDHATANPSARSRKSHPEQDDGSWVCARSGRGRSRMKRSWNVHSSSDIRSRAKLVSIADTSLNHVQRAL